MGSHPSVVDPGKIRKNNYVNGLEYRSFPYKGTLASSLTF
jgi:hypothetical protein